MDDKRVWTMEESLWTGDAEHYRELIDDDCLMVLPERPNVRQGVEAISGVADTPQWTQVEFSEQHIVRPQEGMIVIAYEVRAERDTKPAYSAHCTSTYRQLGHDEWRVVQHQQTPRLVVSGGTSDT